ncbi:hypothetical protein [Rhizobium leguminosarum]|nr:hypothetical protein [Rhizobium leguminosarum]
MGISRISRQPKAKIELEVRKVEKVGGELYNIEFQTFESVKDPAH